MKTYEVDVEMRVRKTLLIQAGSERDARAAASSVVRIMLPQRGGYAAISAFLKWTDNRTAHRPTPVEAIIDNEEPVIVAVRETTHVPVHFIGPHARPAR